MITSFSPLRLRSAKSRTVIGRCGGLPLSTVVRPQFGELSKPECSIRQFRMWYSQLALLDALLLEEHDVEIQCAGPPTGGADTASGHLDPLERGEQILRRQLGFDGDHLIEKRSLRNRAYRLGLLGFGLRQHSGVIEVGDRASRLRQKYFTLAKIGA